MKALVVIISIAAHVSLSFVLIATGKIGSQEKAGADTKKASSNAGSQNISIVRFSAPAKSSSHSKSQKNEPKAAVKKQNLTMQKPTEKPVKPVAIKPVEPVLSKAKPPVITVPKKPKIVKTIKPIAVVPALQPRQVEVFQAEHNTAKLHDGQQLFESKPFTSLSSLEGSAVTRGSAVRPLPSGQNNPPAGNSSGNAANRTGNSSLNGQIDRHWVQYKSDVFAAINAQQTYPKQARIRRREGLVAVRLELNEEGKITDFKITGPAKSKILNEAANALISNLKLPKVPHEIRNKLPTNLTITLEYKLDRN